MARITASFTIEEELLAQVEELAKELDRDRSSTLRQLITVGIPVVRGQERRGSLTDLIVGKAGRPSLTDLIAGPALELEQGVVALTCGCCKKVVGMINADAARREAENGVLHFCAECMELSETEIVARLNAAAEGEL